MENNQAVNKARALYYNLFANFFILSNDMVNYLELRRVVNILKENSLDKTSQEALEKLFNKLDSTSNVSLVQEYDDLFYNPESKKIRLTASYYDEGVESGKKRVEMLQFVAKTKIRRDEKNFYEYEDSIGFIFTFLAELCDLVSKGEDNYSNTIHCVFSEILNDFVDEIGREIYEHSSADIYRELMVVLHSFIAFERLYLEVTKPVPKEAIKKDSCENISEEELQRRAKNKALKALGPKKQEDESCPIDLAYDVETNI